MLSIRILIVVLAAVGGRSLVAQGDQRFVALPCVPPASSQGWFSFVGLNKDFVKKAYDSADVCRLVSSYAEYVYGPLSKYWPLSYNLGLEVEIQESREAYNAAFVSNLNDPKDRARLELIYIPGIPIEPQRQVWSHEYGHAVLDEYIRRRLNKQFHFDQLVRESAVNPWDRSASSEEKIETLRIQRKTFESASDQLQQQVSGMQLSFEKIHQVRESLANQLIQLQTLQTRIRDLTIDILNNWRRIANEQGGILTGYPEGQKILDAEDATRPKDPIAASLQGMWPGKKPNADKIKFDLAEIERDKAQLNLVKAQIARYPKDLEQNLARSESELNAIRVQIAKVNAAALLNDRKIAELDGQRSEIIVRAGVALNNQIVARGAPSLPGFSIYSYYHEFFADLFAVVLLDDPNAIGDAFISIMGPSKEDYADARRFSPRHPEKLSLDRWSMPNDDPVHLFFSPVRAAIGGEVIHRLNKDGKGRLFLTRVMDLIGQQMINYTIQFRSDLILPYDPFIREVSQLRTSQEMLVFLDRVSKNASLSSSFFNISELRSWCAVDFADCQKLTIDELRKGLHGVFTTSIKIKEANSQLLDGIQEILRSSDLE